MEPVHQADHYVQKLMGARRLEWQSPESHWHPRTSGFAASRRCVTRAAVCAERGMFLNQGDICLGPYIQSWGMKSVLNFGWAGE